MATGIVGFHVSVVKHDLQEQEKKKGRKWESLHWPHQEEVRGKLN